MFNGILPEIVISTAAIFFFISSLLDRKNLQRWAMGFGGVAVLASLIGLKHKYIFFHGAFTVDGFSRFFSLLICVAYLLACVIGGRLRQTDDQKTGEFYFFISISTLGLLLVTGATELLTLFIGLEISSYPLFIVASYRKGLGYQFESVAKYMIFGAVSTAFMLYGITYLYGAFGSTFLADIIPAIPTHLHDPMAVLGVILFMAGLLYKLSAFPFHFWAPDVYAGSAAEVVAYIAALPKLAAVALLVRVVSLFMDMEGLTPVLTILAILSMTMGNLMALTQTELKRLLAYSAVSHAGYILLGLLAPADGGLTASLFYGTVYTFMTLAAFLVAIQVAGDEHDIPLDNLAGLWHRSPVLAIMLVITFISLAGLPPTAGFTGKLLLLTAVWKAGYFWPVFAAVINTLIGMFYYLKVIKISLVSSTDPVPLAPPSHIRSLALALALLLLFLGLLPGGVLELAEAAIGSL
ncbi:NADH-quinone oxidoreductase subunit N [Desulfolithobacter dissulfuricans]|uniref:NADH-quinone oxidoreductase subunit N n=1 Tax=Desulfolithobacter dissulfuricans TaxID=2795293 RepID=A0A915XL06_9BACT|nr:NADH-quinone oxidoreductase subunit N [Desulfolithobacter dissulfuricans]BCO10737.1 NADH-quinone oxidoreductase subunit N [Desulfolithobacter dissulfuricans]